MSLGNWAIHGTAHVRVNVSIVPHVDSVGTTSGQGPTYHSKSDGAKGIYPRTIELDDIVACERIVNQYRTNRSDLKQDNDSEFHQSNHDLQEAGVFKFRGF